MSHYLTVYGGTVVSYSYVAGEIPASGVLTSLEFEYFAVQLGAILSIGVGRLPS